MSVLSLQRANVRLKKDLTSWQVGAIGLLILSVLVNMFLVAWGTGLEETARADAERYQAQIESAERIRDMAVQELGALSLRQAREQEAREAQAAAYESMSEYRYIGECTITAYCCEPYEHICGTGDGLTATGLPVAPGIVAVDPSTIPLGATVIIDGQKYLAADTGVTGLHVDVAVPTHQEAEAFGVRRFEVWYEANSGQ